MNLRVLVVEDTEKLAGLLKRGLEEQAFAVDIVATGGTLLTPADARAVVESARMRLDNRQVITLTPREIDILESIERGESVKQTARALGGVNHGLAR